MTIGKMKIRPGVPVWDGRADFSCTFLTAIVRLSHHPHTDPDMILMKEVIGMKTGSMLHIGRLLYDEIHCQETRFLDWVLCRNTAVQWLFVFIGVPVLLLVLVGLCTAALSLLYLPFGFI